MASVAFDPVRYKETTREQWQTAARAWNDWGPALRRWLGPATDQLLDMAGVVRGSRVLDVAAGAGDQTLQIAERVGAEGRVLATDVSSNILGFAAENARRAGLSQVETRVMDGEELRVPEASFDVVFSRVGLIYFPDQIKALESMRRALVTGGRVAAIVYGPADSNGFFSLPVSIIRRTAELPPPAPGQPGPFSLGAPGAIEDVYQRAGLRDVVVRRVAAPLRLASAGECLRFEKESFGALHQMLSKLGPDEKEAAWREVGEALTRYDTSEGFTGPCELVLAVGVK